MTIFRRSATQEMSLPYMLSLLYPVPPSAVGSLQHVLKRPVRVVFLNLFKTITTLREPPNLDEDFLASPSVQETVSSLQTYGIRKNDIIKNPGVFRMPLTTIEQRLQYFAEGGIKTDLQCITDFDSIASSSLFELKSAGRLADDRIFELMVSSAQLEDIPPPPLSMNPKSLYKDIHFGILNHVISNKFDFSFAKWHRYYYAPLQNTVQNINILRNMNLPFFWIQDHPTLTCAASSNNLQKLSELEKKYSLPVSLNPLFRKDSDLAFADHSHFKAILFLLKKYKICRHDILKAKRLDFFLLHPETFAAKMAALLSNYKPSDDNQLNLLYKLKYLTPPKKRSSTHIQWLVERRRNPLATHREEDPEEGSWQYEMRNWLGSNDLNLKFAPCLHSHRSSPKIHFDQDTQSLKKIKSTVNYLSAVTGSPIDKVKIELSRIPQAHTVKVSAAKRTHKLLTNYGFSAEDIKPCMLLLLYPREVVKETLEKKVYTDPVYQHRNFKNKHLHLCLYHILIQSNYSLFTT